MSENIFKKRRVNTDRLIAYGFYIDEQYKYFTDIMGGSFTLSVIIDKNGCIDTSLIEKETGEPYMLYKTNAAGTFIGNIRTEIETVLSDISEKCYDFTVFKEKQSIMLIDYVRERYGDELEFLWEKFDDNAILRRKDNQKWYAVIFTIKKSKLGFESEETAEAIDLKIEPEKIKDLIDCKRYFPGWHMNKKHWYTIILDGSIPFEELCQRVNASYEIANNKKSSMKIKDKI